MRELVKTIIPPATRQTIKKSARLVTGSFRLLPDFLVIGAQKCGTTSLYHYLVEHPFIASAVRKQMHFFDNNFDKGITWYRSHFPSYFARYLFRWQQGQDFMTAEATPYYIFHPLAARRIHQYLPQIKLVLLLRNPVDRTYSHYNHEIRKGTEQLSFEAALAAETERLAGEKEKMLQDPSYYSFSYQRHSYLARSRYVEQLEEWRQYYPLERFLILRSEDFYRDPTTTLNQIIAFLDLPARDFKLSEYKNYNKGGYDKLAPQMRQELIDYFYPYNQRLYQLIGRNLDWDK
jgi:Sulfotransferase domain